MKSHLLFAGAIAIVITGCDQKNAAVENLQRKNAELQSRIEEHERAAKLKAAEELAARQAVANEEAARKLAADRDALEAEKAKLTEAQKAAAEEDFRRREEAIRSEERRLADAREMASKQVAEAKRPAQPADLRAEQPVAANQTLDVFYDSLDPYGNWLEVEGYGHVFEPTVATSQSWRPYTDGNWVHTDQGWAWNSNEPFGWATYHYGRWIRLNRRGWVWVPGSEWAPAWVSWRRSDEYIGWAPLPPEAYCAHGFNSAVDQYYDIGAGSYVFVPHRSFMGGHSYVGRVIDPQQNVTFIHETINVTNISYVKVNGRLVLVNAGPDYAAVRAASSVPVPTLSIQRLDSQNAAAATVAAGVFAVVAPNLIHRWHAKPPLVKAHEARDVDRGWTGLTDDAKARIRERNATEARQVEARQRAGLPATPPAAPVTVVLIPSAPAVAKSAAPTVNPRGGPSNLVTVPSAPTPVVSVPAVSRPMPVPAPTAAPVTSPPVLQPKPAPVVVVPPTVSQPQIVPPRAPTPPPAPAATPRPVRVATRPPAPVATPPPLPVTRPVPIVQPTPPRQAGNPGRPGRPTPTPTPKP